MLAYKEEEIRHLLEEFKAGDESAFTEIAWQINRDIINIAYRYAGNIEDAKDILQEVLLKVHRRARSFFGISKFSTWLFRVTINASIDFLRKRKAISNIKVKLENEAQESFKTNDSSSEKKALIEKALKKLSLRQKNVFILKHFQGFNIEEIANTLGCSKSTVKTHLTRAVESLRKNMEVK
ncbi:MAG: RNA polymerase sigma factor [Candidatus Omnitrophota bacterium]|nr:RNA polymerase sigma factor [Candidatus Omnitrophota bacterium]